MAGFEQGDCATGPGDDPNLPPLVRVQKYAQSNNIFDRQMVARIVQDLFRTAPADVLARDLPEIMKVLTRIGDDLMLRADLLEQIPHIAAQAMECSTRVSALQDVVSEYLIPLVVRNLGSTDTAVDRAAHATLIRLIEEDYITKQQAEIRVCPSILALSKVESIADINTGAVTLMSKLAPLLGRDVTERVFLKRFSELCASHMFYIRKVCAARFGEFCTVVGKDAFEKILLPCYITLCEDDIWGVRKACAEVIMYVSCACPPAARKQMLAPVFAKLLQDDCRWVRMSAFQTLGPFISTFADPSITNVGYNKGGDLILVSGDGSELHMNSSIMNKWKMDRTCDVDLKSLMGFSCGEKEKAETFTVPKEKIGVSEDPVAEDAVPPSKDDKDTIVNELDEFLKEVVETVKNTVLSCRTVEVEQGVIGEWKSKGRRTEGASGAHVINDKPQCDNLAEIINSELKDGLSDVSLDGSEKRSGDSDISEPLSNRIDGNGTSSVEIREPVEDGDGKKVNFVRSENDAREDDDLRLFNSYNYWYTSPDMPLDPSIIAGDRSPMSDNCFGDVGSHLEDLYFTINLSDSLEDTKTFNDDSTMSLEDFSNTCSSTKIDVVVRREPDQDIVPQLLIDHFISMTDPNQAINIDNEVTYHCAFSLPAVALTLGSNNWHLLKNTVDCLAGDMQYKVRRTVASSLHELALILGPEIATNNLTPLFDGFIKDLDEVRIGVLRHLAHFLRLISPAKRNVYLPRLAEFLQTDNESNWRFRQELAKQLLLAVTLFKPADTAKHIGVIARDLLCDKVAAVRQVALSLITEIIKYTSTEHALMTNLLVTLAERFAHSKQWKRRQTFALLCSELLKEQALPPEQFASDLLPHLNDLSWDPVANVRLVVARCLAKQIITNDYFSDPRNEQYEGLEKVLRRLQADKDRDVRQSAEVD
ncbi:serine/threonine-protein phosphatase 4 regulatory subunit 1 isoform X2 [Anoplophora glabripennis]|uniref:serine/threonine-protein phosphatase 4 regulatory subunit 1 isoform X2 n=1 Tax=Anoplophora glabripennis TaxID=217634 RepID=UPI0008756B09|nr:serine/threonine-protein phosphatase 4 regulatory subunit 1 isoform X2 [Anoplophora glabripennis]